MSIKIHGLSGLSKLRPKAVQRVLEFTTLTFLTTWSMTQHLGILDHCCLLSKISSYKELCFSSFRKDIRCQFHGLEKRDCPGNTISTTAKCLSLCIAAAQERPANQAIPQKDIPGQ